MTPKEKAEKLVLQYVNQFIHFPYIDTGDGHCIGTGYMTHQSAKQCALIATDEIIDAIDWHKFETPNEQLNYWGEVKQEIEKL